MNWMAALTGLAIALLCVVLGILIPNSASPLIDGVQAFHNMGLTTISSAIVAIAAVLISQRGLAKLQRQDHQRDLDIRIWESLRQKKEELCRILEGGKIELVETHLNIKRNSASSLGIALTSYELINKDFKNISTIIGLYFQELTPHRDILNSRIARFHGKLRIIHSRKVNSLPGPPGPYGTVFELDDLIYELHGVWGELLLQVQALEVSMPKEKTQ